MQNARSTDQTDKSGNSISSKVINEIRQEIDRLEV